MEIAILAATLVATVIIGGAGLYLQHLNNQHFSRQNEIMIADAKGGPMPEATQARPPRWPLGVMAAAILMTWSAVGYDIYDRSTHHGKRLISTYTIPGPLSGTGAPESLCNFGVNGPAVAKFAELPDSPKNPVVIAICGLDSPSVDIYKDEGITVSKPYSLRPDVFTISVPYSERMAKTVSNYTHQFPLPPKETLPKGAIPAVQGYLWFNLALVPKDATFDDFRSLSDIKRAGGKLLLEVPSRELAVFPMTLGKSK